MFLNHLNEFLLENASGVRIWDEQICAMLYADDLILVAESKERFKNPDESIRCILKSCKNGSEPEENKSGGILQNKKRNPKKTIKDGKLVNVKLMRLKVISI